MTQQPLLFENWKTRNEWIVKNATYFTAFRYLTRQRQRLEAPTIEGAREQAKTLLKENPKAVLIYAVSGNSDTFVEMVKAA